MNESIRNLCITLREKTQETMRISCETPMEQRFREMKQASLRLKKLLLEYTDMSEKACSDMTVDIAIGRRNYNDLCTFLKAA